MLRRLSRLFARPADRVRPAPFTPRLEALDAREVPAVLGLTSTVAHTAAHAAPANFELENVLISNYR
jgi:hypothetical protein